MSARPAPKIRDGLFGPESISWRVNREVALLLGGPRALLLQLAHPLVAAGVSDHSDFERDPLGRLRRTLALTLGIVFGSRREARACAARIDAVHERVVGRLRDPTARWPAGTPYRARDPELLLWVHATLVDTTLAVYPRFVAPLHAREQEALYAESRVTGALLGVPEALLPADLPAFRRYVRDMLASDALEVTPTARRLADAVLHPPLRGVPRWLGDVGSVVTRGLLPPRLRRAYGLAWTTVHRRAFAAALATVPRTLPWLPERVRLFPAARAAWARAAREGRAGAHISTSPPGSAAGRRAASRSARS